MKSKIIIIIILVLFALGLIWLISHSFVVIPLLLGVRALILIILIVVVVYFIGRFRARRNP